MIFSATRFLQYYRIVSEYKSVTQATVVRVANRVPGKKKEKPAVDVVMSYVIDGKEGTSEVTVPADMAGQYEIGKTFDICYYVAGNGAVHIASYSSANKKIMYGHLAAVLIELATFILLWWYML